MPAILSHPSVHIDRALSGFGISYQRERDRVLLGTFPIINSEKQSNLYWEIPRGYFGRRIDAELAPMARARQISHGYKKTPFSIPVYALEEPIAQATLDNADNELSVRQDALSVVLDALQVNTEKAFADEFLKASNWGLNWTGVDATPGAAQVIKWDKTGSDPIKNVLAFSDAIRKRNNGFRPNIGIMSNDVWIALQTNSELQDRITGGSTSQNPARTLKDVVAMLFGLERFVVVESLYNSEDQDIVEDSDGDKSATYSELSSGQFLLAYIASSSNIEMMRPTAGAWFNWNRHIGASPMSGPVAYSYNLPGILGEFVGARYAYVPKVTAPDLGGMMTGLV